jgi:hypothetical protein
MAKTPKYTLDIWNQVKDHQIDLLRKIPEVSDLQHQYVDDFAPYNVYLDLRNPERRNYSVRGFEHIVFTLTCPAVIGFSNATHSGASLPIGRSGPQGSLGKPTKILESDVYIKTEHRMEIYFPRNYNEDPIGWGIRFIDDPPMYPNIMCAHHDNNQLMLNFSGRHHTLTGVEAGMVCIGAAASRSRPVGPAPLIIDLMRTLKILDDNRFQPITNGGVNDIGFEEALFNHYVLNLQTIKKSLAGGASKPKPKKKKLGKKPSKPIKKKLGKRANER